MSNLKTARIAFYSFLHLGATVVFIIAAAFQLRIIDFPDGGEASWYQLILPGIATILISPIVTLASFILPEFLTENLYFFGLSLIVNSLVWAVAIDGMTAFLQGRKNRSAQKRGAYLTG